MGISATPRQMDALRFIQGHLEAKGYAPSFSEIGEALGLHGKSGVARLLDGLEERGAIRRMVQCARSIDVLERPVIARAPDGAPLYFVRIEDGK